MPKKLVTFDRHIPIPTALPPIIEESYAETEARIQAIVEALADEPKPNIKWHADFYNVPYYRLLARWKGIPSKLDLISPNRKLNEEQEAALCSHLNRLDEIGICPLLADIERYANEILRLTYIGTDSPPTVGEGWGRRFLTRHPEYIKQRQFSIEVDRKIAQSPETIRNWLENKYHRTVLKFKIHPDDIWNGDETGFRVGMGKNQWVITQDGERRPTLSSASCRDLITVIETINAMGLALPPMIILPGLLHLESWYAETGLGDDFLLATSESGYSNDENSLFWIQHFEKFSKKTQKGKL